MKRRTLAFGLVLGCLLTAPEVFAVVGRPLTPVSVAGVARRTTRRTVVAGAAVAATATVAATAVTVAALPSGCATIAQAGGTYYRCGGIYYQPVYQGGNLVYAQTTP